MIEAIVGLVGASMLGVLGWAVQIGNRVTILETEMTGLEKLINTRFDAMEQRLESIENAVERITHA